MYRSMPRSFMSNAEGPPEYLLELEHVAVIPAELLLDERPCDELRLAGRNAVQALGEPGVDIEAHGRMGQAGDGAFVEGHGMGAEGFEVIPGEPHGRGP